MVFPLRPLLEQDFCPLLSLSPEQHRKCSVGGPLLCTSVFVEEPSGLSMRSTSTRRSSPASSTEPSMLSLPGMELVIRQAELHEDLPHDMVDLLLCRLRPIIEGEHRRKDRIAILGHLQHVPQMRRR